MTLTILRILNKSNFGIRSFSSFSKIKINNLFTREPLKPIITHEKLNFKSSHKTPPYVLNNGIDPTELKYAPKINSEDLTNLRLGNHAARSALQYVQKFIKPGITTNQLDLIIAQELDRQGAYPACLGYYGFPKASCISVNEVAVHGIPSETILHEGDILTIDVVAYVDGMYGDTSRTFLVSKQNDTTTERISQIKNAIDSNLNIMKNAVNLITPGRKLSEISSLISEQAKEVNMTVVHQFTGHFIGNRIHHAPNVQHSYQYLHEDLQLEPGMVLTIEPCMTFGPSELVVWEDNWTYATKNNALAFQSEDSVLVTEKGYENLTAWDNEPKGGLINF